MVPVALGTGQIPRAQNWHHLHLDATLMHQMQDIFLLMWHTEVDNKLREFSGTQTPCRKHMRFNFHHTYLHLPPHVLHTLP